jgi:uncharacterized RDD family membrane protein YckC
MSQYEASGGSDAPATVPEPRAGFGRRLLATLVDAVVFMVAAVPVILLLGPEDPGSLGQAILQVAVIAYYVVLEGTSGQTVGKRALGIRLVDARRGGSIGLGRAFVRYLARILSSLPFFLGYFWMLWDRNKQTWHDKLSSSVVIRS